MGKRAVQAAAFDDEDGQKVMIFPDDQMTNEPAVYADDHPLVRARPDLFVEFDAAPTILKPSRSSRVEQATAAPGEKRNR